MDENQDVPERDARPEALIDEVHRRFGRTIAGVSPIEEGDEAVVWRVESEQGALIVHQGPAWRSTDELAWTHRVIGRVAARVPEAIVPLTANDGATFFRHDERPVTLFAFIDGDPLQPSDPALVDHSARVLARIHCSLTDWPDGPRPPSRPGGPQDSDPREDPLELIDHDLDQWWAATSKSLPCGIVHGDYYPRNLLCRRHRVVGVIDWHEARIAPIAGEIAWAAWEIAHDDELRLLPDRAARFLDAYGPDSPSPELVIGLMRVWLRENIRYGLMLAQHDQPVDDRYLELQLRAFADLQRVTT